jgi:hypothetical protein
MTTADPISAHTPGRNGLTPVDIVAAIDERLFQRLDLFVPPAVSRAYAAVLAAILMGARIDISTVERVVDATLESGWPAEKNGYGFAIKGGWRIVPGPCSVRASADG